MWENWIDADANDGTARMTDDGPLGMLSKVDDGVRYRYRTLKNNFIKIKKIKFGLPQPNPSNLVPSPYCTYSDPRREMEVRGWDTCDIRNRERALL